MGILARSSGVPVTRLPRFLWFIRQLHPQRSFLIVISATIDVIIFTLNDFALCQ
jgi:hypothetical protein